MTLAGILLVPVYVRFLGIEAFGLVGLFLALQTMLALFDLGLSPMLAREAARHSGGATRGEELHALLRTLELIFLGMAGVGILLLVGGANWLASRWLQVRELPLSEVELVIAIMAPVLGMRFLAALYRSAISGFERLVWLAAFNAGIATLRFAGLIPFLLLVSDRIRDFFLFQLVIGAIELIGVAWYAYRCMPRASGGVRPNLRLLRPRLAFSGWIAVAGAIWVLVTNIDRLVLTRLLTLSDFAVFTVAVTAATGVALMSGPISTVVVPRLSALEAGGAALEKMRIYRTATQLLTGVAFTVALTMAAFAAPLLAVWTGDARIVRDAAPVLALYALGNGVLAVSAAPFWLQIARGELRLHVAATTVFALLLVPLLVWAAVAAGSTGAGVAWLSINLLFFMGWVPIAHRYFLPMSHCRWLSRDVLAIAVPTAAVAGLLNRWLPWPTDRLLILLQLAGASLLLLAVAAVSSSLGREAARNFFRGRFGATG